MPFCVCEACESPADPEANGASCLSPPGPREGLCVALGGALAALVSPRTPIGGFAPVDTAVGSLSPSCLGPLPIHTVPRSTLLLQLMAVAW